MKLKEKERKGIFVGKYKIKSLKSDISSKNMRRGFFWVDTKKGESPGKLLRLKNCRELFGCGVESSLFSGSESWMVRKVQTNGEKSDLR